MHVVADGSGTRHVALAGDGDEMRLLDSASGESTRRAAGDLSRVEADPLAVAAEGVPSAAREALGVEDWRAVGLVAVLVADGPRSVRSLVGGLPLCESDLNGTLAELRAAGLVAETDVGGERGYRATAAAGDAFGPVD